MRAFFYSLLLLICSSSLVQAQTSATGIPYFQQHVHYRLDATFVDDAANPGIKGSGTLDYVNNSPDTLRELYFHLYWNLFTHGSYGESAPNRDHDEDEPYGHGGIEVTRWAVGDDGATVSAPVVNVDNTIARLALSKPIAPGEIAQISFDWTGVLPNFGIRSTWGWHDDAARNFATAQWYPQVCVYDNHGWHPDQYVGMGEFYTDYGMFDVTLHIPDRFTTVVSTGWQTNPEILSEEVRRQLVVAQSHPDSVVRIADHSGFSSQPITSSEPLTTWKFHADSVRDFAWCADEAYIWDAVFDNGIFHHALYWNSAKEFWSREAAKVALLTIQTNSRFAGQYMYPNAFMCETYEGGMEYPGIVFIGPYSNGTDYHYAQNTMMHELGHEWYPMMMGSNETDYGYMDEGFNTFITTFVHEAYFGRYNNAIGPGLGYNDDERTSNYREALMQQLSGYQEPSKQKADMFQSYRSYANATYPHTSTAMFMLRYTMGEKAFADFMQLYYKRWQFKHPYPDDLLNTAEDVERREGDTNRVRSRGDLRWFFSQWLENTWKVDYAIADFDVRGNAATVRIDRKERGVMPLDLVFTMDDGSTVQKWIPVDDWLRTVSDRRTYSYTFDKHPIHVEINPSNEILDVNRLNNSSGWLPRLQVDLVPKIFGDVKPIDRYAIRSAPFLAPMSGDLARGPGYLFGWTLLGSYLNRTDRFALGIRAAANSNVTLGGVLQYHTVLDWLSPWTDLDLSSAIHGSGNVIQNYMSNGSRLSARPEDYFGFRMSQVVAPANSLVPRHIFNLGFDVSGQILTSNAYSYTDPNGGVVNSTIPVLDRFTYGYTFHEEAGANTFAAAAQIEAGLGDPRTTFTKLAATINDRVNLNHDWNIYGRLFAGSMQPIRGDIPASTKFRVASSADIDHFEDLYVSNFGTQVRSKIRNAVATGPLLRGYYEDDHTGRVALSSSVELGNGSLFPFTLLRAIPVVGRVFDLFGLTLFADGGVITDAFCTCRLNEELRTDAGVGLRLLGDQGFFFRILGIDLDRTEMQLDFPLWLSTPLSGEKNVGFRFVGIVRQNF